MNSRSILSLPERVIKRSKRVIRKVSERITPSKKQLLFLFSGRSQYWVGMGHDLYMNEPVFRSSIQQSDAFIRELGWSGILSNFEQTANKNFFEDEANVIFVNLALQIALTDLWKSKNIFPNAVMGVSLGEITAVYTAGGLSHKDAFKIAETVALISKLEKKEFIVLHLAVGFDEAKKIARESPALLHVTYEIGACEVLTFCHKDDKQVVCDYLINKQVAWQIPHEDYSFPYHTELISRHWEMLSANTAKIQPFPLLCDYFSSGIRKMIPKGTIIENEYGVKINSLAVSAHSVLQLVKQSGYEYLLYIGAHPFLKAQTLRSVSSSRKKATLLDSMRRGQPELEMFNATYKKIQFTKFAHSPLKDFISTDDNFRRHFNLTAPFMLQNPYPYFRFLQKSGSVHFLPVHQAWIVLDYNDIEFVLKNPGVFSSTIHNSFDEFLLGADPPDHTSIRMLLMPLFSPQVISAQVEYTSLKSQELLNVLIRPGSAFNLVDSFSLPLAKSLTAKFLGLSATEEKSLDACIKGHVYGLEYFDDLEQYCIRYLEEHKNEKKATATGLLLSFVENGALSLKAAAIMMRTLWVAGMTTTSMLISTAIYMLLKSSELMQKLRENDQLIPRFIEECLRLETPESETKRITTRDTELGGKNIPAGSIIMLGFRAANRDPQYFENPDEVSFERTAKRHLSFGGGFHHCLGMGIARAEARQVIKEILPQLMFIHLEKDDAVSYFPTPHFRGIEKLNIVIKSNELSKHG